MKLTIEKSKVKTQEVSFFQSEVGIDWPLREGEHYRLLTYLTNLLEDQTIIDAGTYQGLSCLCLAQNKKNKVLSYDISRVNAPFLEAYENVKLKTMDVNTELEEVIKSAKLIILDVDPHDGFQELMFTNKLSQIKYEGFVLCDDIYLNKNMTDWWNSIKEPKYDLTDIGHMHGTGIICYGKSKLQVK